MSRGNALVMAWLALLIGYWLGWLAFHRGPQCYEIRGGAWSRDMPGYGDEIFVMDADSTGARVGFLLNGHLRGVAAGVTWCAPMAKCP